MNRLAVPLTVLLLLCACGDATTSGDDAGPTPRPAGPTVDANGVWKLQSGHGPSGAIDPPDAVSITMEIDGDTIRGHAGCNSYGGAVSIDGDSFETGGLVLTEIGCPPDVVEAEERFVEAVGDADTAARDGRTLTLTGPRTELVFRFVPPVDPEPLTGTVWMLDSLVEGTKPSSAVTSAKAARLLLKDDGTFEGTTGCRSFSGTWEVSGDVVSVTQMVFEGDCADAAEQDAHVAAVLGTGFRAARDGDRLTLTSEKGDLGLVYRAQ